jgi:hypothetical protein
MSKQATQEIIKKLRKKVVPVFKELGTMPLGWIAD